MVRRGGHGLKSQDSYIYMTMDNELSEGSTISCFVRRLNLTFSNMDLQRSHFGLITSKRKVGVSPSMFVGGRAIDLALPLNASTGFPVYCVLGWVLLVPQDKTFGHTADGLKQTAVAVSDEPHQRRGQPTGSMGLSTEGRPQSNIAQF